MNNRDGPPTPPVTLTTANLLPPPPNHLIRALTAAFKTAIQKNDVQNLTNLRHLYDHTMRTNLEFVIYDLDVLNVARTTATQLINSHTAASTPLLDSPPN